MEALLNKDLLPGKYIKGTTKQQRDQKVGGHFPITTVPFLLE